MTEVEEGRADYAVLPIETLRWAVATTMIS